MYLFRPASAIEGLDNFGEEIIIYISAQMCKWEDEETFAMNDEATVFKALAEPTRLRLLALLAMEPEVCVCELAYALQVPEFRVSRHLGVMRAAGLVEARREGAWIYYRLSEARNQVEEWLQRFFRDCLADHPTVKAALERVVKLRGRRGR